MNFETIALVVAIASFLILVAFVFVKIPKLKKAPETKTILFEKQLKEKIKVQAGEVKKKGVSFLELRLHKFLSRARILSLKVDRKLSDWIIKLREKSQKKNIDSYWSEIKDSINKKK